MKILETERLILRTWDLEKDLPVWTEIVSDPKVMEFFVKLGDEEEAKQFIISANDYIDKHGFGLFATELKATNELIGFIGLSINDAKIHSTFTPCGEIGWRLAYKYWGKGYATEGAKSCIKLGFEKYKMKEIIATTSVQNVNSRRVMEKLGMSHDSNDDFDHPEIAKDHPLSRHMLYRIKIS